MLYFCKAIGIVLAVYLAYTRAKPLIKGIQIPFFDAVAPLTISTFWRSIFCFFDALAMSSMVLLVLYCIGGSGSLKEFYQKIPFPKIYSVVDAKRMVFLIDNSGSMGEKFNDSGMVSKLKIVQDAILKTVTFHDHMGDHKDLLALSTFARAARIEVPLTMDRKQFFTALQRITPETEDRLNGTAIGYGIFKMVTLIKACDLLLRQNVGSKKSFDSSIILITDGMEEPHPEDFGKTYRALRAAQALRIASENHISVQYIVFDQNLVQPLYQEQKEAIRSAVQKTGGEYFEISSANQLQKTLKNIFEKKCGTDDIETMDDRAQILLFLIGIAIGTIFLKKILENLFLTCGIR